MTHLERTRDSYALVKSDWVTSAALILQENIALSLAAIADALEVRNEREAVRYRESRPRV